jgi:hypothetical protein
MGRISFAAGDGIGRHQRGEQGQDEDDREHGIGWFIIPTNKPAAFGHEGEFIIVGGLFWP